MIQSEAQKANLITANHQNKGSNVTVFQERIENHKWLGQTGNAGGIQFSQLLRVAVAKSSCDLLWNTLTSRQRNGFSTVLHCSNYIKASSSSWIILSDCLINADLKHFREKYPLVSWHMFSGKNNNSSDRHFLPTRKCSTFSTTCCSWRLYQLP